MALSGLRCIAALEVVIGLRLALALALALALISSGANDPKATFSTGYNALKNEHLRQ